MYTIPPSSVTLMVQLYMIHVIEAQRLTAFNLLRALYTEMHVFSLKLNHRVTDVA